ncbi:DIS3-like exonuclease 2 [Hondaea fermentalgiana]|uniref:DIS3-like exonuclease 2 n=1 Tax=Hondaea fermentalgiana TaxID=2315210 RepID=A0A2R5GKK3_9STRA|nr:DIS3-like exonuclease 2 [Hondaea fermentalgiana]|eukprot:GBG31155.1 DIS3-like exonuclease 2 [Hondaea fermentalgiana]
MYYDPWYEREAIDKGIESGKIFVGTLRINAKNRREAFVACPTLKWDIYLDGEHARNRALHGDVVAVELDPEIKWNDRNDPSEHLSQVMDAFAKIDLTGTDDEGLWQPLVPAHSTAAKQPSASASSSASSTTPPTKQTENAEHESAAEARTQKINAGSRQPCGRVVGVIAANEASGVNKERSEAQVHIGVLVPQYGYDRTRPAEIKPGVPLASDEAFVEFRPLDARVPFFLIPRGEVPYEFVQDPTSFAPPHQRLFQATIASWEQSHRFPTGRLIRMVGEAGEIGPETEALLIEHNCDHGEFPEAALDVLRDQIPEAGGFQIPQDEIDRRRDLRKSHRICTIDPATAKDLDDALSCVPVPAGKVRGLNGPLPAHFEIGVHIADVSYFVDRDTPLDAEAQRRATTVYLVNKVIPMLPALLSEELCSLNEGVDRLAYSCMWRMTEDGDMLPGAPPPWFGRTVIRSCARLDYGLAQRMMDGTVTPDSVDTGNPDDPTCWPDRRAPEAPITKAQVIEDVCNLGRIAMARRKKRFDRSKGGALALQAVKMSFTRDDHGNPTGVRAYPLHDSNRTIEEYMLMANYLVAQRLILDAQKLAFIRHHPPPEPRGMAALVATLEQEGISFEPTALASAAGLHETLQRLKTNESEELVEIVNSLLRKPMRSALYATAGSLEQKEWRHWALNIPYYTHFTSPIRRYADVVVHRQLTAVLNDAIKEYPDSEEACQLIAEHCNEKKEASKKAQDASDRLFFCVFIKQRFNSNNPIRTLAVVQELGPMSFTLLLTDFSVDCRVHADKDWGASKITATYKKSAADLANEAEASARNAASADRGRGRGRSRGRGGARHGGHAGEDGDKASGRGGRGGRRGRGRRGRANSKDEDGEHKAQRRGRGKEEAKPTADVIKLDLRLSPYGAPAEAAPEDISLELLSTVTVLLEPTIKASARIDFVTRFVGMSSAEVVHHHHPHHQ